MELLWFIHLYYRQRMSVSSTSQERPYGPTAQLNNLIILHANSDNCRVKTGFIGLSLQATDVAARGLDIPEVDLVIQGKLYLTLWILRFDILYIRLILLRIQWSYIHVGSISWLIQARLKIVRKCWFFKKELNVLFTMLAYARRLFWDSLIINEFGGKKKKIEFTKEFSFSVSPPRNGTEYYIHRSGRTGRAGRDGLAVMLHTGNQQDMMAIRDVRCLTKLVLKNVEI